MCRSESATSESGKLLYFNQFKFYETRVGKLKRAHHFHHCASAATASDSGNIRMATKAVITYNTLWASYREMWSGKCESVLHTTIIEKYNLTE